MSRFASVTRCLAGALACAAIATPAAAQFAKPEDAIKYRQSALSVMGTHFSRIGAVVQGKAPYDPKATTADADIVVAMSKLPYVAFGEGTDKGGNTKAKPEIWKETPKFQAAAKDMQEAVLKLDVAAKTGDLDKIKLAFGDAAKTCKACHDNYREK
jgi:cytochrome c556